MKYQNGIIKTDRKPEIETVRHPDNRENKTIRSFVIGDKRFFVSEFCSEQNGYPVHSSETALVGFY